MGSHEDVLSANSEAFDLFEEFIDKFDENALTEEQFATRNAVQREFSKMDYILKLMNLSHLEAIKQHDNPDYRPYEGLDLDFVGQTEVHAESFYCAAHRLKSFLKDGSFPELKKLKLLPITLIRNKVVEHAVVSRDALVWGSGYGPRLFVGGAICMEYPTISDRGFYPNARDFYAELQGALKTANAAK